jgi:putative ABC transport system ATP-binding protein
MVGAAATPARDADNAIVFDVHDLTKVYHAGEVDVYALRGASARLHESEISVLLGPSGSGKSTFLNLLGGLDRPTSGRILFDGSDLTALSDRELTLFRRYNVGFVFQFYNLIPSLTARENVALVTEISDAPMTPDAALELVGLGNRIEHFPAQLSGGEQQRVAIAPAIAKNPRVLLCDEPTGALDSKTGRLVLEALLRVNEELGTTTAIITHNAVIKRLAHRVFYFADGTIARTERNEERLTPAELEW